MKLGQDSLNTQDTLHVLQKDYHFYNLKKAAAKYPKLAKLPYSLKILLENLLRFEDNDTVKLTDIEALAAWTDTKTSNHEIAYRPTRVLMQDFTGVPAVCDLAAMRDAMQAQGGQLEKIAPLNNVDLVIDHSVMVDAFGSLKALQINTELEMDRNKERYEFLRWGQHAFNNFRVVPPGTGICHQVNLEYLAAGIWQQDIDGKTYAFPDTLVGTDSHTTMINGLGVLGWGVGGIEAEAAMLGQPVSMLIPEVIGVELSGKLPEGTTATDLVLSITQMLRQFGVVGKFVEFFGPGLKHLALADRATIANMAPEYGATCGIFAIDEETIKYMRLSGRTEANIALMETYAKAQGMWFDEHADTPCYTHILKFDLNAVSPSLAGPKRPQDKVELNQMPKAMDSILNVDETQGFAVKGHEFELHHGDVVIAAITSCTNTSNPSVLMAAGLLAKKAVEKGLSTKPWVKTSLAPGSKVVTDYLAKAGLQTYLDKLGFELVGYGCTTCIGNSGPLPDAIANCISDNELTVSAVLSGNRNFEGRVHPQVKANWLASPPLVVAFALMGTAKADLTQDPLGVDNNNQPVYLKDIWPTQAEINDAISLVNADMFKTQYASVFDGDKHWQALPTGTGLTFDWQQDSSYIQKPPFFDNLSPTPSPIEAIHNAKVLAIFGDSITTDHISPAGSIKANSPAGLYLKSKGVLEKDFNSYGSRRGNHEVMMRGTFANIRIRNEMIPGIEGGFTKYIPNGEVMPIYDAAMLYQAQHQNLVIIAGKEYGTGSSRDWAAKGTKLLGVKAVIAESFERIHRSNLIGMGILPLQFMPGESRQTYGFDGSETISLDINDSMKASDTIIAKVKKNVGETIDIKLQSRIDTGNELSYYRHGGILQFVLRQMI
ncbi:MAG: aconitate hydratase AcnA [Gammaproteobacteria bacterium]|nr:aconitate hydratase AcnA [Gammaproteobacteria bacterium]